MEEGYFLYRRYFGKLESAVGNTQENKPAY